jgi:hypothetical protein
MPTEAVRVRRSPARATATLSLAAGILGLIGLPYGARGQGPAIKEIELVHFSHTDYGFTDHPAVCRELQRRYLDIAIDSVLATLARPETERFAWTAETMVAVYDWWQAAPAARREDLLRAVRSGRLEVTALPLNQTATLDRQEWHEMLHWVPEDLWQKLHPRSALQDDVNGFPRAGAVALLDRGVRYFFSGINEDSGGAPFARPSAFWWKMPDRRKLFVYLGYSYPTGYWFFEPDEWRRGPVPRAADARYRLPRAGEFLRTDEASLRQAHRHLLGRIREVEAAGYQYPLLVLSITNQWRIDNDPPMTFLAEFVTAWNRLGLKPDLRLTTVSEALERFDRASGPQMPVYEGEWTDWWANGVASGPREVAASRAAKRMLAAAAAPLWGPLSPAAAEALHAATKDLCLFDEHTWGGANSVALPYSFDTLGQFNEKARLAFRPLAMSEWLLSQRMRTRLVGEGEGLFVANAAPLPVSGWVRMPATCLRDAYRSVEDPRSGASGGIYFEPGLRPFVRPAGPQELSARDSAATFSDQAPDQIARFWVEDLPGNSVRTLRLCTSRAADQPCGTSPKVKLDRLGWPASATWAGMKQPLFQGPFGDLISVQVRGFAPRWVTKDIWAIPGAAQRDKTRREMLSQTDAAPAAKAESEETPHTLRYTQRLRHPRLQWAAREVELWKGEPRARLTVRFYRNPSESPEALFVGCSLPASGDLPRASSGGLGFVPYRDQLPGTCRDYFAIDGWLDYASPSGHRLWVSRDAPLVTFGAPDLLARRTDAPRDVNRVLAMVYNNFWYTNFVGDESGAMEFQFDLAWREKLEPAAAAPLAQTLESEPPVLINPAAKEDPLVIKYLYRP